MAIDLESCGYSDDGVPLEDLEGRDTSAERWAKDEAADDARARRELRAAGIVCSPGDTVYLWLAGGRHYFWSASHAEACIRADARTPKQRASVHRCGSGCGVDGSQGCRRGKVRVRLGNQVGGHHYDPREDCDIL